MLQHLHIHEVCHPAGIGKLLVLPQQHLIDHTLHASLSLRQQHIAVLLQQVPANQCQFVSREVGEKELMRKASLETVIHRHQSFDVLLIASENHQYVRVGLCKHTQERLHNALAVVPAVILVGKECVSFVHEKHIAACLLQNPRHVLLRLSDVLANHRCTVHLHHIALREQAHSVEHFPHQHGNRRLARSRIACEEHVVAVVALVRQSEFPAPNLEARLQEEVAQVLLQLTEADQLVQTTHPILEFVHLVCVERRKINIFRLYRLHHHLAPFFACL